MKRILISGASGFIGAPLFAYLQGRGNQVVRLPRNWAEGFALDGFDAVIHLAGEPIATGRWSSQKKLRIFQSRVVGTSLLCRALARCVHPPSVFISASAIGYYGNRGEELLNEDSPPGTGFLARVACEWEKASQVLYDRGSRTIQARFGVVLDPAGGPLKKLIFLSRLGLGGRLGSGQQWISWIARTDLIHALEHLLQKELLEGPVNIVSPCPLRQKDFIHSLGKKLHRPSWIAIPSWILKSVFGLMADELLLSSQRVQPIKLEDSGFSYRYSNFNDLPIS